MMTLGELRKKPKKLEELGGCDVLVASVDETVVQSESDRAESAATMVFEHETIKMMMAERAEKVEKLKGILTDGAVVIPIRKKSESFWDHVTVGRAPSSDIVLDDPAISNVHAHFEIDEEERRTALQDLDSSNGSHVNRVPLQPHILTPLSSGDVVRFGQTVFYFLGRSTLKQLLGVED